MTATVATAVTRAVRVSPVRLANMIVGKTVPEAMASVFAYGYGLGFEAGRRAGEATRASSPGVG